MAKISRIGIQYGTKGIRISLTTQRLYAVTFYPVHTPAAQMPPVRENHSPEKWYPSFHRYNLDLSVIQIKAETAAKELRNKRNRSEKPFYRIVNNEKIIHIPAIVAEAQLAFDVLVHLIKINIAEQLGRKVAYRKATPGSRLEKALRIGKAPPVRERALDATTLRRIQKHNLTEQKKDRVIVKIHWKSAAGRQSVYPGQQDVKQQSSIYFHEIALNVQLKRKAAPMVVLAAGADMMLQPLNAEQSPLALAARIRIIYESGIKNRLQLIVQIVMYDSVAERCRENLPLNRVADDEAHRTPRTIGTITDIFI